MAGKDSFNAVFNTTIDPDCKVVLGAQNNINLYSSGQPIPQNNGEVSSEPKNSEPDEEGFTHKMKNAHVVLIHNLIYEHHPDPLRNGSQKDVEALQSLFETDLAFKFMKYENCTASRIKEIVESQSSRDFGRNDSFIFIYLGHGKKAGFIGVDDETVSATEILSSFTVDRCPTLGGKPKIFIFQACRGSKDDFGAIAADAEPIQESTGHTCLPVESDFLVCYACPLGYNSYRDEMTGSWFIQSLVSRIKRHYEQEHLMDILIRVNNDVASRSCDTGYKQISSQECRLTKRCYFQ